MPYIPNLSIFTIVDPQAELDVQRSLTFWYISCDPVNIVLHTRLESKTPQGGKTKANGPDRPIQIFKVISPDGSGKVEAEDGTERVYDLVLLGRYDCVIGVGDWWQDIYGNTCEIIDVLPFNGYERRALVKSYGVDPHG